MDQKLRSTQDFPLHAALAEGALVLVALGLGWLLSKPPLETFDGGFRGIAVGLLGTAPLLVLLVASVKLPARLFSDVLRAVDELIVPLFKDCNLFDLAMISILAGLGEEMLFRGVLQGSLAEWLRHFLHGGLKSSVADWIAAAAIAILFGLMHAINRSYAILAGLIGLYLGGLWIVTGDLTVPITTHAVYDFLALAYLMRRK